MLVAFRNSVRRILEACHRNFVSYRWANCDPEHSTNNFNKASAVPSKIPLLASLRGAAFGLYRCSFLIPASLIRVDTREILGVVAGEYQSLRPDALKSAVQSRQTAFKSGEVEVEHFEVIRE